MSRRLPPVQADLMEEILGTRDGILYIRWTSRFNRTVEALRDKGLAYVAEPDYTRNGMHGWRLNGRGLALLAAGEAAGPCTVCRGSGHLSPGAGAHRVEDYGKTCTACDGSGDDPVVWRLR